MRPMDVEDEVSEAEESDDAAALAAETEDEAAAAEAVAADLVQLQSERDEFLETLQRVRADFENYRKRVLREQTELVERATERLLGELLPVLDSFELALANLPEDAEADRVRKGVELVFAELVAALEKHGLEIIHADGVPFDPTVHEAVLQEGQGDREHPVVAETMRTGYKLKGRLLRPSMVKVQK